MSRPCEPLLSVEGLTTKFHTGAGTTTAIDDLSFEVRRGEVVCLVGESGSGKSVTGLSILRLIDPPGDVDAGSYSPVGISSPRAKPT